MIKLENAEKYGPVSCGSCGALPAEWFLVAVCDAPPNDGVVLALCNHCRKDLRKAAKK